MRTGMLRMVAVGLILGLAAASQAQQDDARAIVDRAIEAHGGEAALKKIKAGRTKTRGKIEVLGGLDFTQEITFQMPGKFREDMELEVNGMKIQTSTVFNQGKGAISFNGKKLDLNDKLQGALTQAGARFVLVDYGYDPEWGNLWDNHNAPGQRHPPIQEIVKLPWHLAGTDQGFAALIEDLAARGMLQRTLVVFLTEFGRTPRINPEGGRDHWGAAGSLFFAGGGTRGGRVIGATDRQGAFPITPGYSPGDVAATLYQAIGIDPEAILYDRQNRPLPVLPQGRVIPGVLDG